MSRARQLLQVFCRSRSLTPTGGATPSPGGRGRRRCSLHVPPLGTSGSLSAELPGRAASPTELGARQGRVGRRGSAASPVALLFRSPLGAEKPPRRRSILAQPRLLVTPGSPPELPPELPAGGAVHSAPCGGSPLSRVAASRAVGEGEPTPPPPAGLKFDTPERGEVAEHGLDGHPEATVLGRGAFGTVVLGKRRDRPVAVKVLRGREPSAGELLARRLRHPHLLTVYGVYGLNAAFSTVELEYCGDVTLQGLLDAADAPLPQPTVARYISQLAAALAYCHGEGVMHLDLKPANVIVAHSGDLKLGDFGSARSVRDPDAGAASVRGTVPYMAPELFRGERATCRADVYSLAVCAWQLLAGRRPFAGLEADVVIYLVVARRRRPEPQLPAVAGRWRQVVDRCWAQEAARRPDSDEVERWMLDLDDSGHWQHEDRMLLAV